MPLYFVHSNPRSNTTVITSLARSQVAYLTNPTESSFRTFLTELSFRRHLTKLHSDSAQSSSRDEQEGVHFASSPSPNGKRMSGSSKGRHRSSSGSSQHLLSPALPSSSPTVSSYQFHFVNRASVSLRTPTHVFRSFGLFTIAAVAPAATNVAPPSLHTHAPGGNRSRSGSGIGNTLHNRHRNSTSHTSHASTPSSSPLPPPRGTWFIGAFGRWWVAGDIELLRLKEHQASHQKEKDRESFSNALTLLKGDPEDHTTSSSNKSGSLRAGVLSIQALDTDDMQMMPGGKFPRSNVQLQFYLTVSSL